MTIINEVRVFSADNVLKNIVTVKELLIRNDRIMRLEDSFCKKLKEVRKIKCGTCGADIKTKNTTKMYCSPNCTRESIKQRYEKSNPKIKGVKTQCPNCLIIFMPLTGKQKYCSKKCSLAVWTGKKLQARRKANALLPPPAPRECAQCQDVMLEPHKLQKYCNKKCGKKAENRRGKLA